MNTEFNQQTTYFISTEDGKYVYTKDEQLKLKGKSLPKTFTRNNLMRAKMLLVKLINKHRVRLVITKCKRNMYFNNYCGESSLKIMNTFVSMQYKKYLIEANLVEVTKNTYINLTRNLDCMAYIYPNIAKQVASQFQSSNIKGLINFYID